MIIATCPYCDISTNGRHKWYCPLDVVIAQKKEHWWTDREDISKENKAFFDLAVKNSVVYPDDLQYWESVKTESKKMLDIAEEKIKQIKDKK